jgi:hypothetical protein
MNSRVTEPAKPEAPHKRLLGGALAVLAALWIFLEEWVWDAILALMAQLGRLPPVKWVEARVARFPPYVALACFIVPGAIMLPFKLAAFWLIAHGHGLYGLWVFVVAKVVGTAFLARILALTKPALMTIGWFAKAYNAVISWKERLYAYVRSLPAYQRARAWMKDASLRAKLWWRARFGTTRG